MRMNRFMNTMWAPDSFDIVDLSTFPNTKRAKFTTKGGLYIVNRFAGDMWTGPFLGWWGPATVGKRKKNIKGRTSTKRRSQRAYSATQAVTLHALQKTFVDFVFEFAWGFGIEKRQFQETKHEKPSENSGILKIRGKIRAENSEIRGTFILQLLKLWARTLKRKRFRHFTPGCQPLNRSIKRHRVWLQTINRWSTDSQLTDNSLHWQISLVTKSVWTP